MVNRRRGIEEEEAEEREDMWFDMSNEGMYEMFVKDDRAPDDEA